jgi:hypothetical protein
MKILEVIGEDKYINQLDSDINSTIIAMMAAKIKAKTKKAKSKKKKAVTRKKNVIKNYVGRKPRSKK